MSAEEELVGVAYAKDLIEAEMLQGLLENAGIRSLVRPAREGSSLFSFGTLMRGLGSGPREVAVHASRAEAARAVLAETLVEGEDAG